jgi:hypothetical protein
MALQINLQQSRKVTIVLNDQYLRTHLWFRSQVQQ